MKKNLIVVTGGAGFVGSNLINYFIKETKYNIISYDNYSTGIVKNHIKNKRIKYLKGHTKDITKNLNKFKDRINSIFHFGEFARIYQSFLKMNECIQSNSIGSQEVFRFCLENKIKLIYSATSATLGNNGNDKNLSPYAFTKAKNLEMLENLKKWFNFKFEIVYFYNVYGPNQISKGEMATVIGIFENAYKNNKPMPVVKPGSQTRRFTHIFDTVKVCFYAWKARKNKHYSISNKKSFSILEIAKIFSKKVKFLPNRRGERYASALTNMNLSNRVYKKYGKINIKDYIREFKASNDPKKGKF
jgi:UDP-glucose 4-epimerase